VETDAMTAFGTILCLVGVFLVYGLLKEIWDFDDDEGGAP
jgi:hypothetical protein